MKKKLLAGLLTATMVMGMSLTTFAADGAEIKVNGASNAELNYVQVIEPDRTEVTGWDFSSEEIAEAYLSALGAEDAQAAIEMLIKNKAGEEGGATDGQIDLALSNVLNNSEIVFTEMSNPQAVDKAGVYAINASEVGYTYKMMAAYVGFGEVTDTYPVLLDANINAKKAPTSITKEDDDADNAVAIGQRVEYTITATVPFMDPNAVDKYFAVYDNIEGATYDFSEAVVTIGTENVTEEIEFALNEDSTGFTVDLSAYVETKANQTVEIKYHAVVNALTVTNKAGNNISGTEQDAHEINLYTGQITLTKTDATNEEITLAGAGFEVTKNGEEVVLTFVKDEEGVYTYDPAGDVTEVVTNEDGTVVVRGLDIGTYAFKEVTAPEGYSINETPAEAELTVDGEAVEIFSDDTSMADTRLNALPSTGGIGTTMFTIGGCAIMVAAAYMYFASSRKEEQ